MHASRLFQGIALVVGIGLLLIAVGFWFVWPGVLQFWIWPGTPPLGCAFIAAMLAGGAAPLVWIGLSGHLAAIRAPMLTGAVANAGIALHLFATHARPGNERYLPFAVLFGLGAVVAVVAFVWGRRLPTPGDRSLPRAVRWAFLLFAALLLPVGAALVLGLPYVFPIPLTPDMAAVYGWFFLGSFVYYLYGFLGPSQLNATGQLLSFLVYDLFTIPPYLTYWRVVPSAYQRSLYGYLVVLFGSAIFCAYYLFVDPRTRLTAAGKGIAATAG
jgi:hypothetical protein